MRATFNNRLQKHLDNTGNTRVLFQHTYRCPITAWFEKTSGNAYGWKMRIESTHQSLCREFRRAILAQGVGYLESRTRRRINEISFEDIAGLSEAVNITGCPEGLV